VENVDAQKLISEEQDHIRRDGRK